MNYWINYTQMIDVYFIEENCNGNKITVEMTHKFFMANTKHKLENGQENIPEVNVISPSGSSKIFVLDGWHNSGVRYKYENFKLNIVHQ